MWRMIPKGWRGLIVGCMTVAMLCFAAFGVLHALEPSDAEKANRAEVVTEGP